MRSALHNCYSYYHMRPDIPRPRREKNAPRAKSPDRPDLNRSPAKRTRKRFKVARLEKAQRRREDAALQVLQSQIACQPDTNSGLRDKFAETEQSPQSDSSHAQSWLSTLTSLASSAWAMFTRRFVREQDRRLRDKLTRFNTTNPKTRLTLEGGTELRKDGSGFIREVPSSKGHNLTIRLSYPISPDGIDRLMDTLIHELDFDFGARASADSGVISIRSLTPRQIRDAIAVLRQWQAHDPRSANSS